MEDFHDFTMAISTIVFFIDKMQKNYSQKTQKLFGQDLGA